VPESREYLIVAAAAVFAVLVPVMLLMTSRFLATLRIRPSTPKGQEPTHQRMSYESGMVPTGIANVQFNFRFYLFAILFVIFDVEVVYLLPWAARFLRLGPVAFFAMALFIALVLVGFLYEWRKRALDWH
jgi:NADH:ubiquinone oxidoreductase subunit 3 (subunit A)